MREIRAAVAALGMVVSMGACASASGGGEFVSTRFAPAGGGEAAPALAPAAVRARSESATVKVTNNNWNNMDVYMVRGGSRYRLGTVTSMSTEVFRVPQTLVGNTGGVQLLADPIGSSVTYLSPTIFVNAGETIRFDVQNQLSISSVSIFSR